VATGSARSASRTRRRISSVSCLWALYLLWTAALLSLPASLLSGSEGAYSVQYRLINYLIYLPVLFLIARSLRIAQGLQEACPPSPARPIVRGFLAVVALMMFVGALGAADPSKFTRAIAAEGLPLLAMALVLLGRDVAGSIRALTSLVSLQAILGACIVLVTLIRHPVLDWRGEVNVAHEVAYGLIAPATLAVLLLPILLPWQRVAALIGYSAAIALGFAYQGRLATLLQVVLLPTAWILIQARRGALGRSLWRSAIPFVVVAVAVTGAALAVPAVRLQLERGIEGTLSRFERSQPIIDVGASGEAQEPRWTEAEEFVRTASWKTWLVGEGIGGTWRSEYMAGDFEGYRWPMVHFGPLHLVLKGGLPLLVLYHVLFAMIVIRLWRASRRDPVAGAVLIYAVFTYLGFLSHGPAVHRYSTYFAWVVFGIAFASSRTPHGSSSRLPST